MLLEVAAGAGDGAAGAHAGNQDVDLAVGVLPNLRTRGRLMDGGVGGVYKLAGDHALGGLARQLLGLGDSALHAQRALGQHQLGAVAAHKLASLHAHGLGHGDDQAVAACGGDAGQADAGVAAGGFDDGVAVVATDLARALRLVQHRLGDAILGGTRGVEVLKLYQHARGQVVRRLDVGDLQQRGMSDKLVDRSVYLAHESLPLAIAACTGRATWL